MKLKSILIGLLIVPTLGLAEVTWRSGEFAECVGDFKYGGCTAANLHIDIGVWPVAPGHSVFVVYTHDGWSTYDVVAADWQANVPNPYGGLDESWGVDIAIGYTSFGSDLRSVEYAIWVVNGNGEIAWDSNNGMNYYFPGGDF